MASIIEIISAQTGESKKINNFGMIDMQFKAAYEARCEQYLLLEDFINF